MLKNTSDKLSPRQATEQVRENYEVRPTTLVAYRSQGRLLVIGNATGVTEALDAVPPQLQAYVLLVDVCPSELAERMGSLGMTWLEGAGSVTVSGYLGAFRATANIRGKTVDINSLLLPPDILFDLILDLQHTPAIHLPVPPLGYSAPEAGEGRLRAALDQLAELVGEFDKPKFFEHKAEICAHSASRIEGCRACLETCAAGAITSRDFHISVDPYLCQGCGDCSTVCPAGAMNYLYPRRGDTLDRLRSMLDAWFAASGQEPVLSPAEGPILLLHDSAEGEAWMLRHGDELPARFLPYPLEALGAAGMEVWLSALAYGCKRVVLLVACELTEMTVRSLKEQLGFASELLASMGYATSLIRLAEPSALSEIGVRPDVSERPRARFAGDDDKRTVIRLAVEHLYRHALERRETVPLSAGAPFGEIRVDASRCTLCMSCVSICPERALADGGDLPKLKFIEANCVQCGLCEKACPENAIELEPRYLFDQSEARRARLLHEEEVFHCVECAKPFATVSMIKTITARLQSHPMFQGGNLRRLHMCEDCRVKSMFSERSRKP